MTAGKIISLEHIKPLQVPNKVLKTHLQGGTEDEKGVIKNIAVSLNMSLDACNQERVPTRLSWEPKAATIMAHAYLIAVKWTGNISDKG